MDSPQVPAQAGFLQFDVLHGRWRENLATVRRMLAELHPAPGSLVVLPELWATGFAYDDLAVMAGRTREVLVALQEEAASYECLLAGSLMEQEAEAGATYNTLFVSGRDGVVGSYRKQQLFSPMGEDRHFRAGHAPQPIATPHGLLAGLVCYDLRFPELAQAQTGQGAGLILVSAQWPLVRQDHWRTLLRARAIENQAYIVACNRVGTTAGTEFAGCSAVIDPYGAVLVEAGDTPQGGLAALAPGVLAEARSRFCPIASRPYRFDDGDKLMAVARLAEVLGRQRALGRRIVFTNGCFDILHQGHVTYLEAARRQGDCLVVGLNSDSSIRAIKGPERPVNSETSRARVLAALGCVDHVVLFSDETPLHLITTLAPDVLVKGADWPVDKIVGAREVMARGGTVVTIPMEEGFSTTGVIARIREAS